MQGGEKVEPEYTITQLLDLLPTLFVPERAAGFDTTIQVHLDGSQGGDWVVVIRDQQLNVQPGVLDQPKMTVSGKSEDVLDMVSGRVDPMRAFMSGKIQFKGDMGAALKMTTLFRRG